MYNPFCPACLDDLCADGAMPLGIDYATVCEVNNDDKIDEIFFTSRNKPLAGDPSLAASWTARLSNTLNTTGLFPIRYLKVVKGEKPAATLAYKTNRAGNGARLSESPRKITLVIDDDSDAMYELMRELQCNGNVAFAYRSGKHIYGMEMGVGKGTFIDAVIKPTYAILDGSDLAHRWSVDIDYTAKCEEPRVLAAV